MDTTSLSIYGWGWTSPVAIHIETDSAGNVTVVDSGIQSLLPQQATGTALHEVSGTGLPLQQLEVSPYDLSNQDLLPTTSLPDRSYQLQADGTYKSTRRCCMKEGLRTGEAW
jgi:hypothetical protein